MSGKYAYLLTVLTGPNAGAQQRLTAKKLVLGSSDKADIVLDQFDGADVELAFSRDRLRVMTNRQGVRTQGGEDCKPGHPLYLDVPVTLHLSPLVQINICAANRAEPSRLWNRLAATAAAIAVLGGAVYGVQTYGGFSLISGARASADFSAIADFGPVEAQTRTAPALVIPETVTDNVPVPASVGPTISEAAEILRTRLEEAGLTGLDLHPDAGVLRVGGTITNRQSSVWRSIRRDYENAFAHVAPLLVKIDEQSDAPPLAIASVWLGMHPEVITRDGRTLALGDTTENGWRVEGIAATEVELVRGRQTIVLEF